MVNVEGNKAGFIQNPILPGFNPDPCIVRVEEVYYIAVSSFEWLPGVRIYESSNLADWEHCRDPLTHQVDLRGNPKNCSIWAPQLSYHDGLFYLMYTDVKSTKRPFKDCHNYLITAPSIHGPWSEPVYLNSSGFDPSLYHDDDGRKWLLNCLWDYRITEGNKSSGIVIQEYDSLQGKLIGEPKKLFDCTPLKKTEAPHIYKRNGYYYLITAEGGTGSGHAVTVARSKELLGPYEVDPQNPMLTSRNHPELELQCAGHGSLIETPQGEWYMAHLCTRPVEGEFAILGRETALQQVYWDEQGWLRLTAGGNTPQIRVPLPKGLDFTPIVTVTDFEDDFTGPGLKKNWNTLRILADENWCSLSARAGYLRIQAGESLQSLFNHHIVAIRQTDKSFRAETMVEFDPVSYLQMAGLMLYLNEDNYWYAYVSHEEGKGKVLRLMRCERDEFELEPVMMEWNGDGAVQLAVDVSGAKGQFYYRADDQDEWHAWGDARHIGFLSGGFTGNFIGIAAHDMNRFGGIYADFDYFRYQGRDRQS
ncbi:glycoside hydrolase family 43 protein [Paenibacillus sp. Marseille-P2973]|uniref:glycoside hydrolase family 43 protein n=1 Tax=Paenibacillus sp. Marseille-P2973 TaxID=1871032 RepID=UPI001B397665|nr:glycoside hydrolase family 43 protein [Paenibacillus sp. Marseille-P2973]MBQ4897724.1 glycoside hydrolase family 43 protein [Paenibacillus sp. Marseille-P2973]